VSDDETAVLIIYGLRKPRRFVMKKSALKAASQAMTLLAAASVSLMAARTTLAQNAFDRGTPAEAKGGQSSLSTYAQDKIETVNLANGNLNIHIPLVSMGGRGSASYTLALSHNSKLWSGQHDAESITNPLGQTETHHHYACTYDDGTLTKPNLIPLGAGWSILKGPVIRVRKVNIDPITCSGIKEGSVFKYVLTKVWIVLPDGSEVEMRDELTDGAPYLKPVPCDPEIDRDRGRVWHSTDGSAITYVTDAANGVVAGQLSGYVFLADGTRMRMVMPQLGGSARCTFIYDPNGNFIRINYNSPSSGDVTYTDQLGRTVILRSTATGASVTITGYNGLADRIITTDTGQVGANLRADYANVQFPIVSGDYNFDTGGHSLTGPHTDLFWDNAAGIGSDEYAVISELDIMTAVTRVNLLDGRSFTFRYNPYGEVAEIVYPAGGVSQINYSAQGSTICDGGNTLNPMLNRRVTQRKVFINGVALDAVWSYAWGFGNVGGLTYPKATLEARNGSDNALLMSEAHYFLALDAEYRTCSFFKGSNGTANEKWENAKEFRVERQTGAGTQVDVRTWEQRASVVWGPDPGSGVNAYAQEHGQEQPPNDTRTTIEDNLLENGKLKRVRYEYDGLNNVTRLREYDFGAGVQGTLVKDTTRTYLSNQNGYCYTNLNGVDGSCGAALYTDPASAIHRRRLLLNETVKDSLGNVEAYSEFEYDNYLGDGSHAPIQINAGMIQYDGTWFSPFAFQSQPRGNVTRVKRLISGSAPPGSGTYVTSFSQYDEAGNVVKAIDPRGNATTVSYQDNFGDGSNPDVGASGANGATFAVATSATNALGHVVKTQHDYTRGVMTGIKDANGTITRSEYNDAYDRPTRVTAAYGLAAATRTEMSYPSSGSNQTTMSKQLDSIRWLAYKTTYDGFGRPLTANEAEDGNHASVASFTIFSKLIYDGLGRVKFATNPYRAGSATTDGWSRTAYDLAGRSIDVATFSGAPNSIPPEYPATTGTGVTWTGSVTTAYASEATTVTDQAAKVRRSIVDGLGRLARVDEPDSTGDLGSVTSPVQPTSYGYDARGNLKTVTQGTQPQRTFSYDLLSRLMSAINPESGTINYTYDGSSNLLTKLDARGITTTYAYDALNRVTSRTYTDSTPAVAYKYDAQALPGGAPSGFNRGSSVGRLVAVNYGGGSAGSYSGYDVLGRANVSVQQTDAQNYGFTYAYNLASEMTTESYPSGRTITNAYDAGGRLSSVNGQKTGEANKTYASSFSYTPHDAVASMQLGNGKWEHTTFNSRLQPTQIGLGTSATNSSLLQLDYGYGTIANNGNVLSQTITVAGSPNVVMSQIYGYDSLNRLQTASENIGSSWSQTYGYDRYGNRWVSASVGYTLSSLTPQSSSAFNTANNKLIASQYDNAGNQTVDAQTRQFTYDAENRQLTFNTTAGQYFYDGDGHRVKKIDSTGTTVFVYNAGGQLIAEYHSDPVPPAAGGGGTSYLTSDHLGSTRVVTDAEGNVKARHDYLPFGEELGATIGPRTTALKYDAPDSTKQKFTQKERDTESGLDYFLARYYSSEQGRFTSPDEFTGGPDEIFDFPDHAAENPVFYADLHEPQSLNKYQYCYNNPLSCIDPDGHKVVLKTRRLATSATGMVATAASMAQSPNPAVSAIGTGLVVLALIGEALITRTPAPVPAPDTTVPAQEQAQPQTATPPQQQAQPMPPPPPMEAHKTRKRESTRGKHERGEARAKRDYGREKGDMRRGWPRKPPPGHKGPWPPKTTKGTASAIELVQHPLRESIAVKVG
jgi:RHS repeat-associated protein